MDDNHCFLEGSTWRQRVIAVEGYRTPEGKKLYQFIEERPLSSEKVVASGIGIEPGAGIFFRPEWPPRMDGKDFHPPTRQTCPFVAQHI